jgi:hypothetical protein
MMQQETPVLWIQTLLSGLKWPAVVIGAYWAGRRHEKLEGRLTKAEKNVSDLAERHMPAVHRALAEIRGLLLRR